MPARLLIRSWRRDHFSTVALIDLGGDFVQAVQLDVEYLIQGNRDVRLERLWGGKVVAGEEETGIDSKAGTSGMNRRAMTRNEQSCIN